MSDEQRELRVFGKSRSFKARRKKLLDNYGKSIEKRQQKLGVNWNTKSSQ